MGLLACNNPTDKSAVQDQRFDCHSLTDKQEIFRIAGSIIHKHDNEQIWNLSEMDTTDFYTTEDFFTNAQTKNRLVLIGGSAGLSSGTTDNLLILFSCSDKPDIVWSGQVGDINPSDIKDLNGDGIKEIICNSSTMWMGECSDSYCIFNFKDNKRNFILDSRSTSVLECGRENIGELFKQGDTLEYRFDNSLIKLTDKAYHIQQIRTTKIHNGGVTDDEIIKSLKVSVDTTYIKFN